MGEEIMSVVCASFTAHGRHVNMKIHRGSHRGDDEEQMQRNKKKIKKGDKGQIISESG